MNRYRKDVINDLKAEIKQLKIDHIEELKHVRKEIIKRERTKGTGRVKAARKKKIKQISPIINARAAVIRTKVKEKVKGKAVDLADRRIQYLRMKNVVYMDGALCFPIMLAYSKVIGISPYEMQYLILLNVFKEGRTSFFTQLGMASAVSYQSMKSLNVKGFAERFGEASPVFTPNLKGKRAFLDFRNYYRETITRGVFNEKLTTRHKW